LLIRYNKICDTINPNREFVSIVDIEQNNKTIRLGSEVTDGGVLSATDTGNVILIKTNTTENATYTGSSF